MLCQQHALNQKMRNAANDEELASLRELAGNLQVENRKMKSSRDDATDEVSCTRVAPLAPWCWSLLYPSRIVPRRLPLIVFLARRIFYPAVLRQLARSNLDKDNLFKMLESKIQEVTDMEERWSDANNSLRDAKATIATLTDDVSSRTVPASATADEWGASRKL